MWGIDGSHQPQWLDALSRSHATVEDRVRGDKAMGLRNLPSKKWQVNDGWMLAANLGHDLDCWLRLLTQHDQDETGARRARHDAVPIYSGPHRPHTACFGHTAGITNRQQAALPRVQAEYSPGMLLESNIGWNQYSSSCSYKSRPGLRVGLYE
ncbi:hypothetical protein ACGFX8_35070 [Streptomyces sp. NPDC048362]|uniref:hypothetical protein n=1 Tax=Streptomyces sp. NPDC048362 TaxID=3365539 RepID=UPI00371E4CE4